MTLDIYIELLKRAGDLLEQRYLSPVFLVGSFQHKFQEASDIDIVMIVTEERMQRLTGDVVYNDKRFQFNRKQKLFIESFVHGFDIDFKVQTEKEANAKEGEKLKLGKYVVGPE